MEKIRGMEPLPETIVKLEAKQKEGGVMNDVDEYVLGVLRIPGIKDHIDCLEI